MKKILLPHFILASSVLFNTTAMAEGPNWNYLQASYAEADLDDEDEGEDELDLTGFGLSGSALLNENIFITAYYRDVSDEVNILGTKLEVDSTGYSIGLGYRHAVTVNTDIFGVVAYEEIDAEVKFAGFKVSEDENGHSIKVGVRSMVTKSVELEGSVAYVDISDESDTNVGVAAFYHFNKQFSVGARYVSGDDIDTTVISGRFSF